jgi:hypothetical protein
MSKPITGVEFAENRGRICASLAFAEFVLGSLLTKAKFPESERVVGNEYRQVVKFTKLG